MQWVSICESSYRHSHTSVFSKLFQNGGGTILSPCVGEWLLAGLQK